MKWIMLLAFCAACAKASDSFNERQIPKLAPQPHAVPAATLSIAVEVDGKTAPPIDAARLAAVKPDFEDSERRAWKLVSLLGPRATGDRAVVAVTGDDDVTVQFRRAADARLPVLALTRRGEIVVALVDAADPFPSYHGQGRRLRRPGDPSIRIGGVKKISLYEEPR